MYRRMLRLLLLFLLAACAAQTPRDLSFETLDQGDGFGAGRSHAGEWPALLVFTDRAAVAEKGMAVEFPAALLERLQALDYRQTFVILALQGLKGGSGYGVQVERVVLHDQTIRVQAQFTEPRPDQFTFANFTSPYHLITVPRDGIGAGDTRFQLLVQGQVVAETSHLMP